MGKSLNKTIYVGTSILWLSKVLTKNFHYNYVHNRYSDTAVMLLTDKDSLMYEIKAENVHEDFYKDKELFVFSYYLTD